MMGENEHCDHDEQQGPLPTCSSLFGSHYRSDVFIKTNIEMEVTQVRPIAALLYIVGA